MSDSTPATPAPSLRHASLNSETPKDKREKPEEGAALARFLRLWRYVGDHKGVLTVGIIALIISSALSLVYPRFLGMAVDAALTQKDVAELDRNALWLLGAFSVQAVFVFIRHYCFSWLGERAITRLRTQVHRHLLGMPQSYFHRNRTGELLSRLSDDVTRLQDVIGQDLSMALRNLMTLVGGIAMLFYINAYLTAIMLMVVPPLVVVTYAWGRVIRRVTRRAQDELAAASGSVQERLSAIDTVQAFVREGAEGDDYANSMERVFALFVKRIRARSWFMATSSFFAFSAVAGIFWLGGRMVVTQEITTGTLTEFFLYTVAVAGGVGAFAGLAGRYQQAVGATARIFEILDERSDIIDRPGAQPLGQFSGTIDFDEIEFSYQDRGVPVLKKVSIQVPAGQQCALVGASGSGKTTLGRLLLRFWDPQGGAVRFDGQDIRDLPLAWVRGQIAVVSQEPVLFSGTIRENIRYGNMEANDAQVRAAAESAFAHPFIEELPDGYETRVGERGVKLSGGQRQRIAIARALLRDPKILLLDEATSALDSESEHWVQRALETLSRGRTTIVIAHRLSTIRDADSIVVLDHGEVVETGSHAALMQADGAYARLVARQTELGDKR